MQPYDDLIRRFPQNSWLIATRIRNTTRWFKDDRVAGTLEDTNSPPLIPPPTKAKEPHNFSPQDLERCISIAQLGRSAEPQNSFYDWWLAYFLFAGYRDNEAFEVLSQGAQKAFYDDHTREELQARIYTRSRTHNITAEMKTSLVASQLLPHYTVMYHFCRLLAWRCRENGRRGQHHQALRLVSDVTRLSRQMRNYGYTGLDSMVANSLQAIVWKGVVREFTPAEKTIFQRLSNSHDARTLLLGKLVAAYANRHNNKALAALVTREVAAIRDSRKLRDAWYARGDYSLGLKLGLEKISLTLWLGSQIVLFQVVLLSGLIVLLLGLAWPVGMEAGRTEPRDIQRTVAVCLVLFAFALGGMYAGGAGWHEIFGQRLFCGFLEEEAALGNLSALIGFCIPAIVPALVAIVITRHRSPRGPKRQSVIVRSKQQFERCWQSLSTMQNQHETSSVASYPGMIRTTDQFVRATLKLSLWTLRLATITTFLIWGWANISSFMLIYGSSLTDVSGTLLVCEVGVLCIVEVLRARWWHNLKTLRVNAHSALRWYRTTLLAYLILCGWLYLALSVANIVPRRAASSEVDSYVQRGESATRDLIENK